MLRTTLMWKQETGWEAFEVADDGFSAVVGEAGEASKAITMLAATNPIFVERALALTVGVVEASGDWHDVKKLDSCAIDATEVVRRMTFCQDIDAEARKFRVGRLKLCAKLFNILKGIIPSSVADMKAGFTFGWSPDNPHQNVRSDNGKLATLVYVGELATDRDAESIKAKLEELLNRSIVNEDDRLQAKQRLVVWHHKGSSIEPFQPYQHVQIDQSDETSAFGIGRER